MESLVNWFLLSCFLWQSSSPDPSPSSGTNSFLQDCQWLHLWKLPDSETPPLRAATSLLDSLSKLAILQVVQCPVSPLTHGPANDIPQPPDFLDLPTSWTAISSIFSGYARPSRFSWPTTPSRFPRPSRPASVSTSSQPARPARALVSDSCQTKLSAATTAGAATYIQVAAVTAGSKPASWSRVSSGSMAGSVAIFLLFSCPVAGLHLCHLASALHPCHQYPTLHSCLQISVLASCRQSPVLASCCHHLPQPLVARSSLVLLFCGSQALPAPRWFYCLSKTSCL